VPFTEANTYKCWRQLPGAATIIKAEARVMVVDDDPQILASLQTLLEPLGFGGINLEDPLRFWEKPAIFARTADSRYATFEWN